MKEQRTKIVATIGPTTGNREMLEKMVAAGADVFRFNFSHGDYETFAKWIAEIRKLSHDLDQPIAILADLKGPRIRVGELPPEGMTVGDGQEVYLTQNQAGPGLIPIDYPYLLQDIKEGSKVLLVDGLIEIKANAVLADRIKGTVIHGGVINAHKGVNLPDTTLSIETITEKDKKDLAFMVEQGIDWIALSFVRSPKDMVDLRALIKKQKPDCQIKIIAKIEKQEAVDQIDEILAASDGVMVARGDLGIELPAAAVPTAQKLIIAHAIDQGKPVITATQMLESMIINPRPTRAEVSDIANAILDGTDAIMLSGETATGKYPVESVALMASVITEMEKEVFDEKTLRLSHFEEAEIEQLKQGAEAFKSADAVGAATAELAHALDAKMIIATTTTGQTAMAVSKHRPKTPIIAPTPNGETCRQLSLAWGVRPYLIGAFHTIDELIYQSVDLVTRKSLVTKGDVLIITAGHPVGADSHTNLVKLHVVE